MVLEIHLHSIKLYNILKNLSQTYGREEEGLAPKGFLCSCSSLLFLAVEVLLACIYQHALSAMSVLVWLSASDLLTGVLDKERGSGWKEYRFVS